LNEIQKENMPHEWYTTRAMSLRVSELLKMLKSTFSLRIGIRDVGEGFGSYHLIP